MPFVDCTQICREGRANKCASLAGERLSSWVTGPTLPWSVESNVEQYLKKSCCTPAASNAVPAATDWVTASAAGVVRDLIETTMASAPLAKVSLVGIPRVWGTRMPLRDSVSARSVAPVRSSVIATKTGRWPCSIISPDLVARTRQNAPSDFRRRLRPLLHVLLWCGYPDAAKAPHCPNYKGRWVRVALFRKHQERRL